MIESSPAVSLYWGELMRVWWTVLALLFGFAALYLAGADYDYPIWTWSIFFLFGASVYAFFNGGLFITETETLFALEFLLWFAALCGGTFLFGILLDHAQSEQCPDQLPTARDIVRAIHQAICTLFWR